jgi:DUSP domain
MPIVIPEMTPQQQADAVISTESREHERPRKAGDRVFLISANWFASWCDYTGHAYDPQKRKLLGSNNNSTEDIFSDGNQGEEKPRPGPIDCSDLIDPSPTPGDLSSEELAVVAPLRPGLKEKEHFWILHEATWQLLKSWYGCSTGSEIVREYIAVGGTQRRLEVHHDQWHLKAVDEHSGRTAVIPALKMSNVAALKDAVCAALDIEDAEEVEIASYPRMAGEPLSVRKIIFFSL